MSLDLVTSTCDSSNYCCDSSSTYTVPVGASDATFMCYIHPVGDTYTYAASDCPTGTHPYDNGVYIQCKLSGPSYAPSSISSCSDSTCATSYWELCGCETGAVCSISGYDTYLHAGCQLEDPSGSTFTCPNGWNEPTSNQCQTNQDFQEGSHAPTSSPTTPPPSPAPTYAPTYAPGDPTPAPTHQPTMVPTGICSSRAELACGTTAATFQGGESFCILTNATDSSSCPSGWAYGNGWYTSGPSCINLGFVGANAEVAACTQSASCLDPLTYCGYGSISDIPSGFDVHDLRFVAYTAPTADPTDCPEGYSTDYVASKNACLKTVYPLAGATHAPTNAPTPAICETVEELACANTAFTPVDYSPAYCILWNPADSSSCPSGWTYDPDWDGSPACEGQYIVNLKDTGIAACTQSSDCLNPLTVCGFASDSDLPSGFDVYDITFTSEVEGGISAASDCPEGYTFNGDDGCSKQVSLHPPTPTPTMAPTGICSSAAELSCATSAVSTFPGEAFSACILHNVSDSTSCPSGWIYLASWSYISKPFCYSAANYLAISTGIVACTQSSSCLDPLTYCGFGSTSGIPSGFNVNNLEFLAYADTVTDPSDCPEGWDTAYVTSNNMCTKHVYPFAPTPAPTEFPTSAGQSTSEAITFGVSQSLSGLSKTDWDSNEADNLAVFKAATAQLLGCAESNIDNVVVADSSRRRLALSHEVEDARALSTSSVTITYDVVLQVASGESSSDVYTAAVNVIVDSTASGCSTNCLATVISEVAEAKGVSSADIVSATVTPVSSDDIGSAMTITIPAPTATPTSAPNKDDTWMTTEVIAGMAAVVIVIAVVCCVGACILGFSRKKNVKLDDHAQEDQPFVEGGTTEAKKVAPVEVAPAEEVYEI